MEEIEHHQQLHGPSAQIMVGRSKTEDPPSEGNRLLFSPRMIYHNNVDPQEGAQKRYGHLVSSSSPTVPQSDNKLSEANLGIHNIVQLDTKLIE